MSARIDLQRSPTLTSRATYEKRAPAKRSQDLRQRGQGQGTGWRLRDLDPANYGIMANHSLTIRRPPHIEFKPIAAMLQTQLKRRQGIFRNVPRGPRPAMSKQEWTLHPMGASFTNRFWERRFWEGHGFSRAAKIAKNVGFSP
jgi:hypothetical protein